MDFTGKTAIVTGAGRGLGWVYARELAKLGANVVISDIGADNVGDGADATSHERQLKPFKLRDIT